MTDSPTIRSVGFIGLGIMGAPMAGHLKNAGYELHVYNRSRAKAEGLLAEGAVWHDTVADLAASVDAVLTIIGYPQDVEAVYLGADGLLAHAKAGALLIDMTTSHPKLAQQLAEQGATRGVDVVDAPVSGGAGGAKNAALTVMVGATEAAYARAEPLLSCLGKNVVRQGPPGSGQHTKMANQIIIATTLMGICEGLAYAREAGLNPETVLASIQHGSAGSFHLTNTAPKFLAGDIAPGFYVHHLLKDLGIAAEEAQRLGLDLKGLDTALSQYRRLGEQGHSQDGIQSLWKLYGG